MAGLKVISEKIVALKDGDPENLAAVLSKISNATGVPGGKICEARVHFEGADRKNPRNGTLTVTVAYIETKSLAEAKAALDSNGSVNVFDLEP